MLFDRERIIIFKIRGQWRMLTIAPLGSMVDSPLGYDAKESAGNVAVTVARQHPKAEIGIHWGCFGPAARQMFGDVIWMRDGFGLDRNDPRGVKQ